MQYVPIIAVLLVVILVIFITLTLVRVVGNLLRKVGPNEALIVYGTGGTKIVTGGSQIVLPLYQRAQMFSLELLSFNIVAQALYTTQGVAVNIEANIQIKVRGNEVSIRTASEQFLSKSKQDRENLIGQVMKGHLRAIVGQLTVESLVKDPETVNRKMLQTVTPDMEKMGLEVISFTIREVRDDNDFINNMGRPQIDEIRKRAEIVQAETQRDIQIQQANAARDAAIAKAHAAQERVRVEAEVQASQAEYQRNLALKKAEFDAEVRTKQAIADKAYDIQANIIQQQIVEEAVKVTEIEKLAQIKVQQAEIQRREMELQATTLKQAEAERQRIILESQGQALATKTRGVAEAEVVRARGQAEAEAVRARGEAEAEAMKLRAAAFHEYNQAAVLDKLLTSMPDMVRAIAEPLSKVDKVTIVSTGASDNGGSGSGLGTTRLTGDIVNMVAQVPVLFELLSGKRLDDLMNSVPGLSSKDDSSADGATNSDTE